MRPQLDLLPLPPELSSMLLSALLERPLLLLRLLLPLPLLPERLLLLLKPLLSEPPQYNRNPTSIAIVDILPRAETMSDKIS